MEFTEAEAKEKVRQRVRVIVDGAFHEDELAKGTTGTVVGAEPSSLISGAGAENVANPNREIWVVSIQFDNQTRTFVDLIGKEEYARDLEEI